MGRIFKSSIVALLAVVAVPAAAEVPLEMELQGLASSAELPPYLQCVPVARQISGIQIYGDAWTWWDQADGRYARGHTPKIGAVMAFRPSGSMTLGHVAAVSKVVDSRTVLLTHANWSPIDGHRGQIERDVRAVDVSPGNDWSQVRVWYAPLGGLGTTAWPVQGFIYPDGSSRSGTAAPSVSRSWASQVSSSRAVLTTPAAAAPRRDVIGEIIRANS